MKHCINIALLLSILVLSGCLVTGRNNTEPLGAAIESFLTDISEMSCQETIDHDDPNSTPHHICPGVSGYELAMRHVGSGRQSIGVITPTKKEFSLELNKYVTRHMSHIDEKAEWRLLAKNGNKIPIALIIGVKAHENLDEPEQVTHTYIAITKITSNEICVTDKILAGTLSQLEVYDAADSAQKRDCLKPLPDLVID